MNSVQILGYQAQESLKFQGIRYAAEENDCL